MASCSWSSSRSTTARSGGGCAWSRCAASISAAASTTSPSRRAGSRSIPGWSPPSITALSWANSLSSGNAELDALLGGGLERGTNALLIGAAGVGKSSLALTYAIAAAQRGRTRGHSSPSTKGAARSRRARSAARTAAGRARRIGPDPLPADRSGRAVAGRIRRHRPAQRGGGRRAAWSSSTA